MVMLLRSVILILLFFPFYLAAQNKKPNVVLIYVDDLGYGDLSCYGATKIKTPNLDKLAGQGIRFTNGHSTSATCTPSRYALMTGEYPWRKKGTGVLPGDAALIIPLNKTSEKNNVAEKYPEKVKELSELLEKIRSNKTE